MKADWHDQSAMDSCTTDVEVLLAPFLLIRRAVSVTVRLSQSADEARNNNVDQLVTAVKSHSVQEEHTRSTESDNPDDYTGSITYWMHEISCWTIWLDYSLDDLPGPTAAKLRLERWRNWDSTFERHIAAHMMVEYTFATSVPVVINVLRYLHNHGRTVQRVMAQAFTDRYNHRIRLQRDFSVLESCQERHATLVRFKSDAGPNGAAIGSPYWVCVDDKSSKPTPDQESVWRDDFSEGAPSKSDPGGWGNFSRGRTVNLHRETGAILRVYGRDP